MQNLAQRLRRLSTPLAIAAALLCCFIGLGVLFLDAGDDRALIPAILGVLWCLSLLALIHLFQSVDLVRQPNANLLQRFTRALRLAGHWLLAVLWIVITLAVVVLSLRLGSIWLGES